MLLVGDGPDRAKLEARVSQLHLRNSVIFAGSVDNSELPEFYADADLVAIPSLNEATSIAGLEAMASGCAIVASHVGGLPEIVDEGKTGFLVPPSDPEQLAEAMRRLLKAADLRAKFGEEARLRIEREFSWDRIAHETTCVYREAIASWHERTIPQLASA